MIFSAIPLTECDLSVELGYNNLISMEGGGGGSRKLAVYFNGFEKYFMYVLVVIKQIIDTINKTDPLIMVNSDNFT